MFNVLIYDNGIFVPYDIIPYLVKCYNEALHKPKTFKEFKNFVDKESKYQYWSRCEYEIILSNWPNQNCEKKIDVYDQIQMNLDVITKCLMEVLCMTN